VLDNHVCIYDRLYLPFTLAREIDRSEPCQNEAMIIIPSHISLTHVSNILNPSASLRKQVSISNAFLSVAFFAQSKKAAISMRLKACTLTFPYNIFSIRVQRVVPLQKRSLGGVNATLCTVKKCMKRPQVFTSNAKNLKLKRTFRTFHTESLYLEV
jgi:hypothetical protein